MMVWPCVKPMRREPCVITLDRGVEDDDGVAEEEEAAAAEEGLLVLIEERE